MISNIVLTEAENSVIDMLYLSRISFFETTKKIELTLDKLTKLGLVVKKIDEADINSRSRKKCFCWYLSDEGNRYMLLKKKT